LITSVNHITNNEAQANLTWRHTDNNGRVYLEEKGAFEFDVDSDESYDKIKEFYDLGLSCTVDGIVMASKVTGQLTFKESDYGQAIKKFKKDNKDKFDDKYKIQVNHVINSLTFGDTHNFFHIKKHFG
jgi:hypothetical protein